MGTLQILFKSDYIKKEILIKVIAKQNEIMLLNTGTHQLHKSDKYQYVSFIPVNGEVILSLSGFKYNLNHQHLEIGSTLTISNEVKRSMAIIEVEKGQSYLYHICIHHLLNMILTIIQEDNEDDIRNLK